MTIATEAQDFKQAVSRVASVVKRRNTLPILDMARVEGRAGDNHATIRGTNLDMQVTARFAAQAEHDTTLLAPADPALPTTADGVLFVLMPMRT